MKFHQGFADHFDRIPLTKWTSWSNDPCFEISLYEFYESKMGVFGVNPPEIFNSKVQTNLDV